MIPVLVVLSFRDLQDRVLTTSFQKSFHELMLASHSCGLARVERDYHSKCEDVKGSRQDSTNFRSWLVQSLSPLVERWPCQAIGESSMVPEHSIEPSFRNLFTPADSNLELRDS